MSQAPKGVEEQWGILLPTCVQRRGGQESSSLMAVALRAERAAMRALVDEYTLLASPHEGTSFELQRTHENLDVSSLVGRLAEISVNRAGILVEGVRAGLGVQRRYPQCS